jgi:hypothetical protein
MKLVPRALAVSLALAAPAAALAHHGWGWTADAESRLSGTIQTISFGNPHMHIELRAANGTWDVDLAPPSVARGSGFGPDVAKAGDRVILTGHRSRNANERRFKAETVTVDGRTYDVYPQREKTLRPAA